MKGCARFIAIFTAIVLVVALPLSILAYDVGFVIFNGPLVKSVLTEIVTESDLIPAALAWFSEAHAEERYAAGEAEAWVDEPDVVDLIEFMGVDEWRQIRWEVLLNEFLAEWVSVSADGTYAWIDSEDQVPDIAWDLTRFKSQVNTDHGSTSIAIAYSTLPDCTQAQIDDFKARLAAAPAGTEVLYNLCEFPDPWYEDQFSDYLESLEDLVAEVPNIFHLTDRLSQIEDTMGVGPGTLKTGLRLVRTLMNLAWLAPVILLLLILALAIRTLKSLGRWWGVPLIIGSIFTLALDLLYRPLVTQILAAGPLSETPELITGEATQAILRLAAEIFKPLLWQSLIVLVVALIVLLAGSLVKRQEDKELQDKLEKIATE